MVVGGSDPTHHRLQAEQLGVAHRVHFVGENGPPRAIFPRRRPPRPSHQERSLGERARRGHGSRAADRHERRRRRRRSREEPRRRRRDRRPVTDRPTNRASGAARRSRTDDASRRGRTKRSRRVRRREDTRRRRWRRTSASCGRSEAFDRRRARVATSPRTKRVATLPPLGGMNPYQRLLYEHLRPLGFELVSGARLTGQLAVGGEAGCRSHPHPLAASALHVHEWTGAPPTCDLVAQARRVRPALARGAPTRLPVRVDDPSGLSTRSQFVTAEIGWPPGRSLALPMC